MQKVTFRVILARLIISLRKMSLENNGLSVSPGTMLSVVCLLLNSAGFIRIELKFNDHDQRLMAVEEVISQMKNEMAATWNKGKVCREFVFKNTKPQFCLLSVQRIVSENVYHSTRHKGFHQGIKN